MPFTIAELRADMVAALGGGVDSTTWSVALLDEAARAALHRYALEGSIHEASVIAQEGPEQDLSAVADLLRVEAVAWPWVEGCRFDAQARGWRMTGPMTISLVDAHPTAGDVLRLRYRAAQSVEGLDGALVTTVPGAHRRTLAAVGKSVALRIRLRQIGENPAVPPEAAGVLAALLARAEAEADALLAATSTRGERPVWGQVGL